jgi:CubicO group peptidase (beta-lactamase class C family)
MQEISCARWENRYSKRVKTSLTLLVLLLILLIGLGHRPACGDGTSADSGLNKQFQPWDRPEVPGGAVAVVRDGQVVVARGFGSVNLDDRVPISTLSVFEMGSVAKSFVCAALALLMDQGEVRPDDDIRKFLPEMPPRDPPIRVRHLVRCETGLPEYYHAMQLAGWDIEDAYTGDDVLALLTRRAARRPAVRKCCSGKLCGYSAACAAPF